MKKARIYNDDSFIDSSILANVSCDVLAWEIMILFDPTLLPVCQAPLGNHGIFYSPLPM